MKWTLTSAAAAFQTTQETLRKRLAARGHKVPRRGRGLTSAIFTTREIHDALTNDKDAALVRKLTAEAEAKERKNRRESENLISPAAAEQVYLKMFSAMCKAMDDQLPDIVSRLAAERDPAACRKMLNGFGEGIKRAGRESA